MVGPKRVYAKPEDDAIFDEWLPSTEWLSIQDDANLTISIAQRHQATWLVLDDYRIDEAYQYFIRAAGLHWLQFDGIASKPLWADIVLNVSPAVRADDYQGVLRNPNSRLLLGPTYTPLRPEFRNPSLREPGRELKQILVTFGGGDDLGANQFVLSCLLSNTSSELHFVVISGQQNPNICSLKSWIDANAASRVALHIEPSQVAPLFLSSDLAIMAGGTSTHEAAASGLPMILISIAKNQVHQSKGWEELGAAIYLGSLESLKAASLSEAFRHINNSRSKRYNMAIAASRASSAQGADRVADTMLNN